MNVRVASHFNFKVEKENSFEADDLRIGNGGTGEQRETERS